MQPLRKFKEILTSGARNRGYLGNVRIRATPRRKQAMSFRKPPFAFTAGLVVVSLSACFGVSTAAAKNNDHKRAVVAHRTYHGHRLYDRAGTDPSSTWSQQPQYHCGPEGGDLCD
jgi:hypothetical protein